MTIYDEMSTDDLIAGLRRYVGDPIEVDEEHFFAAVADRLAAYKPIVSAIRDLDRDEVEVYHIRFGHTCWFCRANVSDDDYYSDKGNEDIDAWHEPSCPWVQAQRSAA